MCVIFTGNLHCKHQGAKQGCTKCSGQLEWASSHCYRLVSRKQAALQVSSSPCAHLASNNSYACSCPHVEQRESRDKRLTGIPPLLAARLYITGCTRPATPQCCTAQRPSHHACTHRVLGWYGEHTGHQTYPAPGGPIVALGAHTQG